jgi:hypothetical protein
MRPDVGRPPGAAPMWHFLSDHLIAFVIRTPSPWLYSFIPKDSIVMRASFAVGDV